MPPPRSQPRTRPGWWWQGLLIALLGAYLLLGHLHTAVAAQGLTSADGPWHLWAGRVIVETGGVPTRDPVCYTTQGLTWVNPDWLAQVALYLGFDALGFAGPLALATALFGFALLGVALHLRARQVSPLPALLALGLVLFALEISYSIRPRGWSYAFLAWTAWLLARPDPELRLGVRSAAALLGINLLWLHLHGGVVYGLALLGLDAAGSWLDSHRRLPPPRSRWLLGVAGATVLGYAWHPHGFAVLLTRFRFGAAVLGGGGAGAQLTQLRYGVTGEMRPLDPREPLMAILLAFVGVALVAIWRSRRRVEWRAVFPAVFFLYLTVKMRRIFVPLTLVTAPWVACQLSSALRASRLGRPAQALELRLRAFTQAFPAVIALGLTGWLTLAVPGRAAPIPPGSLSPAISPQLPVAPVRYLLQNGLPGRVFSSFDVGGLLGWVFYPQRRVFLDGRTNLDSSGALFAEYMQITRLESGWREALAARDVQLVLMRSEAQLVAELAADPGWERVYDDHVYAILRRLPPAGQEQPAPGH